jgi:CheY-like chemotaxis protein
MNAFAEFEQSLQDALAHLYDPAYRPPEILWTVTGCKPQHGLEAIQMAVIQAIEDLKPASHVPPTARSRRVYGLLFYRYVQDLTQEETAERLGITPRHLRRERSGALHVLALHMWEQSLAAKELAREEGGQTADAQLPVYRSQVKQELAFLQESAPGAVADVGEAIGGAIKLGSTLTSKRDIGLQAERIQPNLVAAIHPSVLRQVLIMAIGQLSRLMSSGQITLCAERKERNVTVSIAGQPAATDSPPKDNFIRETLAAQGGSVEVDTEGNRISIRVELPSVDLTVLVVDDNADLIHLYRRYVVGTRYHIVHTTRGQRVFEIVEASAPDVIVLDVMLPDVDGWELLAHLHEHSATRAIPVIVGSVVREKDLALALGAACYLPKPIERQQFVQALDQVLSQAAARAPRSPANNAATC